MPHRVFTDARGTRWEVWGVLPEFAERRSGTPPASRPAVERRTHSTYRVPLETKWANGWLAFKSSTCSRRLAPFPANWDTLTDEELDNLCASAVETSRAPRRLIE